MSRNQRFALIGVAVAIAVAAFVILSPGGEDEDTHAPAARTTTGQGGAKSEQETAKPSVTRIQVKDGKPVGGIRQIAVKKGDTVALIVRSPDTASEVHVHGFDLMKDLEPGRPVSFLFRAGIEGVFDVELEETETQIASLKVEPR
jgi:FtsP/CotA-like multicopper oxidase with cupredoxin domain